MTFIAGYLFGVATAAFYLIAEAILEAGKMKARTNEEKSE